MTTLYTSECEVPLVSCLMVTGDRARLCARAIACYEAQSYPNTELVVVDDGSQDLGERLARVRSGPVVYLKLDRDQRRRSLGELRNLSLDAAQGELLAQWDDDDWYHPDRLTEQVAALGKASACVLASTLMHVDSGPWSEHPYEGSLPGGVPGTIVHRRAPEKRYPEIGRAEDTVYLEQFARRGGVSVLAGRPHLFLRCYHGANTWEQGHFLRRMRNRPGSFLSYVWSTWILRAPYRRKPFQLSEAARHALALYRTDSRRAGLLPEAGRRCA